MKGADFMIKTPEEILQYVKDENIKSINLSFCDIFGNEKNVVILPEELKSAFTTGVPFNISDVKNFGEGIYKDVFFHPEPETFANMAWRPDNDRAIRMFCNMTYPDGTPFVERGTKSFLKQAIRDADDAGFEFYFSTAIEFYLLGTDEYGLSTREPYDTATLYDIPPEDKCEPIRRSILLAMEHMDIFPNNAYHEDGPGQNKISFGYLDPLTAGNHITTLKAIIKNEARNAGLFADFSPKPVQYQPGNGFNICISVRSRDGSESQLPYAVAGIMNRIRELTAFLNPMRISYDRLSRHGAPKYVTWTSENREHLFRMTEGEGGYYKAELRSPDSTVNPYLAFALLIYAGLEGLRNLTPLDEVSNIDLEKADMETLAQFKLLPQSFEEACKIARDSDFVKEYVPEDIVKMYLYR
jgi:glutamine synthetase